jgi:hypothetical protein
MGLTAFGMASAGIIAAGQLLVYFLLTHNASAGLMDAWGKRTLAELMMRREMTEELKKRFTERRDGDEPDLVDDLRQRFADRDDSKERELANMLIKKYADRGDADERESIEKLILMKRLNGK